MAKIRLPGILFALCASIVSAEMHIPVGLGHRVHVCGQVVDQNLRPIMDTLELTIWVTRPLMTLEGVALKQEYVKRLANSKFCIDASFVWRLSGYLSGPHIYSNHFRIEYRGIWKDDFKWVVERNPSLSKPPNRQNANLAIDAIDTSWGYSIGRGRYYYSESKQISNLLLPEWFLDLKKMAGDSSKSNDQDSLVALW
ncbi:MAG: hypothetical protein M3Y08_19640, partial [Fibrobacterota bacterium]|nr:hypothetical protein [Fibrobacterota bacterium]